MNKEIIIDAKGAILGRLASFAAKQALIGKNVIVVNCQEALITGKAKSVIEDYRKARKKGGANLRGPYFPKHPEKIVKRTIRGMLAHRQTRGAEALKRIRCYNDLPEKYLEAGKILAGKEKNTKTISLLELSREI